MPHGSYHGRCGGRCLERSVCLVKTDTECNDLQVISGASRTLHQHRILAILVEVTLGGSTERHFSINRVAEILVPFDFKLSGLYDIIMTATQERRDSATPFSSPGNSHIERRPA